LRLIYKEIHDSSFGLTLLSKVAYATGPAFSRNPH